MNRISSALKTIVRCLAGGDWLRLRRYVASRLWVSARTVLYRCEQPVVGPIPEGVAIERMDHATSDQREVLVLAGAGDDLRNFDAGALCYLARLRGCPVGLGWSFKDSPLLRRLRLKTGIYTGGFHVIEPARGHGIYQALLRRIAADVSATGCVLYAEASPDNVASRRGLARAGFVEVGYLETQIVAGIIVWCKVRPWTS